MEAAADVTLQLIELVQGQVGGMLEGYPPAAIAWSGFCTITPFLLKPIKENQKMREGLEYVISRMTFLMKLARLLLRDNWKDDDQFQSFRDEMADRVQLLYQRTLEYEMRCVKACHNRWTLLRNAVGWNGWEDQIKLIQKSENNVNDDMAKYNSEAVKEYLRKATTHLEEIATELKKAVARSMTQDHDKLIGKFNVVENTNKNPVELNRYRIPKTCEWFRTDDRYKEWLRSDDVSLLLVSAPPGCGKSVLAAYLVEEELPDQWRAGQICHYFFDDQQEQRNVKDAMRAIIHQLLVANPEIAGLVEGDVGQAGKRLMENFGDLVNIFKKAAESGFAGRVICVMDALNECELGELDTLVRWIRSFSPHGGAPSVKFVVTAQGLPDILKKFEPFGAAYRHISTEDERLNRVLQEEIKAVMSARFLEFAKSVGLDSDTEKQDSLWKFMEEASRGQRTYLWLKLVFEALYLSIKTKSEWEAVIKFPPLTIVSAYDRLFKFVKPQNEPRVRVLLHLIYAASATRPLTVSEANISTTIHLSDKASIASELELKDDMMLDAHFREWVIQTCGFFVSIYDDHLYFIHQTARNYLSLSQVKLDEARLIEGPTTDATAKPVHSFGGCLSDRAAHAVITECCVAYLSINEVMAVKDNFLRPLPPPDKPPFRFLNFSVANWLAHFRMAQEYHGNGAEETVVDIDDRFSDRYFTLWEPVSGELKPVIKRSMWSLRDYTAPVWSYEPLSASIFAGQAKLLDRRLSLAKERDRNAIFSKKYPRDEDDDKLWNFCLSHIACCSGYIDLVRFILDRGANIEERAMISPTLDQTLVHLAVRTSNPKMTEMLLERGAEVDAEDAIWGGTPLAFDLQASLACAPVLLDHQASWEKAFKYLDRMQKDHSGPKIRGIIKRLDNAGLSSHEGFLKAARAMGYDPEEMKAREKRGRGGGRGGKGEVERERDLFTFR